MGYLLIIVICLFRQVICDAPASTMKTVRVETTTEAGIDHEDIAEEDAQAALNLDYGRYTTQRFRYINSQYASQKPVDKCLNDYIKCLTEQGVALPVCAYNHMDDTPRADGFFQADSYCDVFYDNCRRYIRFWRILDYGSCRMLKSHNRQWHIPMTARKFSEVMLDNTIYK